MNSKDWIVYILKCSDGTYYTGITNNMQKRLDTHNSGKGAKYTKARLPIELIAFRTGFTRGEACRFERIIKRQRRDNKVKCLAGFEFLK